MENGLTMIVIQQKRKEGKNIKEIQHGSTKWNEIEGRCKRAN